MRTVAPVMRAVEQSMFPDLRADRAVGPIPHSVVRGNNADLMHELRGLYLTGSVLDVTYGRGGWWKRVLEVDLEAFRAHDARRDGVDFRDLPHADASWDTVCFDPPYVIQGGPSSTAAAAEHRDRYGITEPRTQAELDALVFAGLAEALRVACRFVLVKCMDYVTSGRFVPMSYRIAAHALELGAGIHDEVILHGGTGPGGHNIVEPVRARRAHSKLLVLTPPRRPPHAL